MIYYCCGCDRDIKLIPNLLCYRSLSGDAQRTMEKRQQSDTQLSVFSSSLMIHRQRLRFHWNRIRRRIDYDNKKSEKENWILFWIKIKKLRLFISLFYSRKSRSIIKHLLLLLNVLTKFVFNHEFRELIHEKCPILNFFKIGFV